jgi:DNA-binding PucR family transcriptional regulator
VTCRRQRGRYDTSAAETLGIHRNTLGYRLRQIRSVISADLDDPQLRLSLQLALVASELPPPPQ